MLKFICKDNCKIYLNPIDLCKMDNLKDSDNFKKLFSDLNLLDKNNNDECLLLKNLGITSVDWLEFISFIKYNVPMYYTLNIFNNPNKKEKFIINLEKLNLTCSKLGGIKSFDKFYLEFLEKCKEMEIEIEYNPQEPNEDYKKLYTWGFGNIAFGNNIKLCYEKYSIKDGWSACKMFIKKKEPYIWYRRGNNINST